MPSFPMSAQDEIYFRGSQHIEVSVTLSNNGRVDGSIIYKNDSMMGYCGQVVIAFLDASGNIIDVVDPGPACINGKPPGHEIRRTIPISTTVQPSTLQNVASMKIKAFETQGSDRLFHTIDEIKRRFTS